MLDTQQDVARPPGVNMEQNGGRSSLENSLPLLKQMLEAGKSSSGEKENRELEWSLNYVTPGAWKKSKKSKPPVVGPSVEDILPWLSSDAPSEVPGEDPSAGFTCEECGRCFAQKRYLKRHLAVHGDGRCEACERGECFLKEHTSTDTYECDVCKKSFTRKSSLIRHCRVHAGEKPFSCEVCSKTFSQGSDLVRHMRIHTAEKPFECEVCGKAFARKNSLTRHKHVHSGQKPFACEICNKKFALRAHLRSHKRIYTGEKPYACEICLKVFSHSSTMQRHRLTHDKG